MSDFYDILLKKELSNVHYANKQNIVLLKGTHIHWYTVYVDGHEMIFNLN